MEKQKEKIGKRKKDTQKMKQRKQRKLQTVTLQDLWTKENKKQEETKHTNNEQRKRKREQENQNKEKNKKKRQRREEENQRKRQSKRKQQTHITTTSNALSGAAPQLKQNELSKRQNTFHQRPPEQTRRGGAR